MACDCWHVTMFIYGMMTALMPSFIVLALLLMRSKEGGDGEGQ